MSADDAPRFVLVETGIVEGPHMERLTPAGERCARAHNLDPRAVEMRINSNTRADVWTFPSYKRDPAFLLGDGPSLRPLNCPEVSFCRRWDEAARSYLWAPHSGNPPCHDCPGDESRDRVPGHTIRCGTCDRPVKYTRSE